MNIELIRDLTEEQKETMRKNSVTNKMFNKRIDQGWSLEETISLPRTFKLADDGLIYKQLRVKGELYHLSSKQYLHLVEIGVDLNRIYTRIAKGEPFEIAIKRKVSENLEDLEERLFIEEYHETQKQNVIKPKELRKKVKQDKTHKVKISRYWKVTYNQMMKQF